MSLNFYDLKAKAKALQWMLISQYVTFNLFLNSNQDDLSVEPCIFGFASVYFNNGFFIIGGSSNFFRGSYFDAIYRLDKNVWKWSEVGRLNTGRINHGAIIVHKWCRNTLPNF